MCSARRRFTRSSALRRRSRTPRSSSRPHSRACVRASSSRCAGATSTSPAPTSGVTASYTNGELSTPKSGKVRSVPMAPEVTEALAQLGQRERFVRPDGLVFLGQVGGHLDASALLRRYRAALRAAGLRPLRFHDLRHVRHAVIGEADIRRMQEWMGHADVQTTTRYLQYAPRHDDAAIMGRALATGRVTA